VKNIFPGGVVANLRLGGKPNMSKTLGVQIDAVDAVEGSNLCPDETAGIPGTYFATADVHFTVEDENGAPLYDEDHTITCINGVDNPEKIVLVFDGTSCGPDGFEPGVHNITTTVTGEAGNNERVQVIRCRE